MILHFIVHFFGLDYGVAYGHLVLYNFWSGVGSDISEVTIIGMAYGLMRKHQCHTKRCYRIGRHVVNGTPWCDKHHGQARKEGINA